MAWVKMEKNGIVTEVPDTMYEKIYKVQGFKLVEPKPKAETAKSVAVPKIAAQPAKPEIKPTTDETAHKARKPKGDIKILS